MLSEEVWQLEEDYEKEHPVVEDLHEKAHSEGDCNYIKTQFVRDRRKDTEWDGRRYIDALMSLESYAELSIRRQSPGFGGALAHFHLRKRYRVEHKCMHRPRDDARDTYLCR